MTLPARPGVLTIVENDITTVGTDTVLWRIHPTRGSHPQPWDQLRFFGPTANRFDPHPPPPQVHIAYAVSYTALDPYTPFAEVYQRGRTINTGRHDYCGAWAHAIHDHPTRVDGLRHTSAMAGKSAVTLFTAARDSFPPAPAFSRSLIDDAISPLLHAAAGRFNYRITP